MTYTYIYKNLSDNYNDIHLYLLLAAVSKKLNNFIILQQ